MARLETLEGSLQVGGLLDVVEVRLARPRRAELALPLNRPGAVELQDQRARVVIEVGRPVCNTLPPSILVTDRLEIEFAANVGSGGLTGKGWHKGDQTALGFLPSGAAHNDFIFSVIAEEKGFFGSMVVLTLYGIVLFTGLRIAGQARDRLGKLLAVGIVTLWFSHVFINIGMNIHIVPVTGIPLPLLSYGGSSVLGSLIAIGMLQNVYIHRKAY